jgi:hypothetical protein
VVSIKKMFVSLKQRRAAKKNIKKAQAKWRGMSSRAKAKAQPKGRGRAKPGTVGEGKFYRVAVRPKSEFTENCWQKKKWKLGYSGMAYC